MFEAEQIDEHFTALSIEQDEEPLMDLLEFYEKFKSKGFLVWEPFAELKILEELDLDEVRIKFKDDNSFNKELLEKHFYLTCPENVGENAFFKVLIRLIEQFHTNGCFDYIVENHLVKQLPLVLRLTQYYRERENFLKVW